MIIKMKKAHIVVLQEKKDELLKSLQRYGVLMIINQEDSNNNEETQSEDAMLQKTKRSRSLLKKYQDKKSMFGDYNTVDYDDFMTLHTEGVNTIAKIDEIEEEINNCNNNKNIINDEIKFLDPWYNLELHLDQLNSTKFTNLHIGYIETRKIQEFILIMEQFGCIFYVLDSCRQGTAVCFYNFKDDEESLMDNLKQYSYTEIQLPYYQGTVKKLYEEKQIKIKEINEKLLTLKEELKDLSEKINDVEIYNDQLLNQKKLKKVDYLDTITTTYIVGWVRSDQTELLQQAITDVTDIYDLELEDPQPKEVPPTYTKNNRIVAPFESITDMFSKPNYREADPNPVMSIWYWILFGMMVGDVGYGIVLLLFTILFIKLTRPKGGTLKLVKVLMYSSIPTMLWGLIFNSFFGATIFGADSIFGANSIFGTNSFMTKIAFVPLDSAILMLVVSVVVGALHLLTGLVVKAIASIKAGEILDMLSGQLSWILIILGIGGFAGSMFTDIIPYLNYISIGMIVLGALFVILLKGRHKKGIINKAISGVLGLYDITSYMSDLLSYTRIMALVMSSAAVAMVMNILAGMVQGNFIGYVFSILIYIIGHTFNLVLGLLSAYIHDSRLQYIEFFGKFYEGGGYDFKPLSLQTQYVYEIKDEKIERN